MMNHDATHCLDQDAGCPRSCFRVELNKDYQAHHLDFMHEPVSWAHLRGMKGCPRRTFQDTAKEMKGGGDINA